MKKHYSAVVEDGSWLQDGTLCVTLDCGHKHRTFEAAHNCGAEKHPDAAWYGFRIHDETGRRAEAER